MYLGQNQYSQAIEKYRYLGNTFRLVVICSIKILHLQKILHLYIATRKY